MDHDRQPLNCLADTSLMQEVAVSIGMTREVGDDMLKELGDDGWGGTPTEAFVRVMWENLPINELYHVFLSLFQRVSQQPMLLVAQINKFHQLHQLNNFVSCRV